MKSSLLFADIEKIRSLNPLVHNITNYVVMNNTANALLALGASPVMAHAAEEVKEMVSFSSALVINIGTLSHKWIEAMGIAMEKAKSLNKPIVFDPVGAGATMLRNDTCAFLFGKATPTIIRGNGSEIMALANVAIKTKGVDSSASSDSALSAAKELATALKCVVVISGETDYITNGKEVLTVKNGNPMMTRITGMGCTATALCGAFSGVNSNAMEAAHHAMITMGICGEIAADKSQGPGSLQVNFIDALYNITSEDIEKRLKQ